MRLLVYYALMKYNNYVCPCHYSQWVLFECSCWLSYGDGTYAMWTLFVAPMLLIILVFMSLSYSVLFIVNKIAKYKQMAFYAFTRMMGMVVG